MRLSWNRKEMPTPAANDVAEEDAPDRVANISATTSLLVHSRLQALGVDVPISNEAWSCARQSASVVFSSALTWCVKAMHPTPS